ncbi:hypothetical protein OC845_001761 [Tilletia horrida]|nr:hypothetical protein OC845_001761 [Tilletia horrida]
MKLSPLITLITISGPSLALALSDASSSSHQSPRLVHRAARVAPRAPSDDVLDINNFLSKNFKNGDLPPGHQAGDADGQVVEITSADGEDDNSQTPQCSSTLFIGGAANGGTKETGWQSLPQVTGFDLKRDLVVDKKSGAVQPYYELAGRDASKVKRVLIVQPGLPRDSWKYTNLFRNALICAAANSTIGVKLEDVIVAGPAWLNVDDVTAGAAKNDDVVFSQGQWAFGSISKGPGDLTTSSYSVLDAMVEKYFDKSAYPSVNQIWIAGHSLGGLLVQHYAMVRKSTADEPNINFWMGNPGSYVWPVDTRPVDVPNSNCTSDFNTWPYGMRNQTEDDVVVYRRKDMMENAAAVKQEYFSRHVVYALGLKDNGDGDDHCEAHYQGSSHLDRGQNMEKALRSLPGGAPASHVFDYVPDVSHQDYRMISSPNALWHLFGEDLNVRRATRGGSGSSGSGSSPKTGSGGRNPSTSNNNTGSSSAASSWTVKLGFPFALALLATSLATAFAGAI